MADGGKPQKWTEELLQRMKTKHSFIHPKMGRIKGEGEESGGYRRDGQSQITHSTQWKWQLCSELDSGWLLFHYNLITVKSWSNGERGERGTRREGKACSSWEKHSEKIGNESISLVQASWAHTVRHQWRQGWMHTNIQTYMQLWHTHTQRFCLLLDFFTYSPLLLFNRKLVHLLKTRKFILIPLFTCTFAHTPAHLLSDLFIDPIGLF